MILAKKNNEKFPHSLTAKEDEIGATDGFRSAIDIAAGQSPKFSFTGSFKDGNPSSMSWRTKSFSVHRAVAPFRRTSSTETVQSKEKEDDVRFQGVLYKMVTATECNSWHERLVTITQDAIIFQKISDKEHQNYVMDAIPLLEITECSRVHLDEEAQIENMTLDLSAQLHDDLKQAKPQRKGFRKGGFRASSVRAPRRNLQPANKTMPTLQSRSSSLTSVQNKFSQARAAFTGSHTASATSDLDPGSPLQMARAPTFESLAALPFGKSMTSTKPRQRLGENYAASSDGSEILNVASSGLDEASGQGHHVDVARLADDLNAPVKTLLLNS